MHDGEIVIAPSTARLLHVQAFSTSLSNNENERAKERESGGHACLPGTMGLWGWALKWIADVCNELACPP